jgi:hypothetical protein
VGPAAQPSSNFSLRNWIVKPTLLAHLTPQNCRHYLFHIESLILPLYGPKGSSS